MTQSASIDVHGTLADLGMVTIESALFPRDLALVLTMFRAYAGAIGVDLGFQEFDAELTALPGKYAPPAGRLLLAWRNGAALGCVALRPIDATTCEIKRLYLVPAARGEQLGRRLVERICAEARAIGYHRVCLDTLPGMQSAIALYRSLGFRPIEPYVFNPIAGALFLGCDLLEHSGSKQT